MILAIDQYGQRFYILGKYPRKELMEKTGAKKADKIYIDQSDGKSIHIGYAISGRWYTLYKPWEGK